MPKKRRRWFSPKAVYRAVSSSAALGVPSNANAVEMTVTLEPGSTYEFTLNSPTTSGFFAEDGIPLLPTPVKFTTRGGEQAVVAPSNHSVRSATTGSTRMARRAGR